MAKPKNEQAALALKKTYSIYKFLWMSTKAPASFVYRSASLISFQERSMLCQVYVTLPTGTKYF